MKLERHSSLCGCPPTHQVILGVLMLAMGALLVGVAQTERPRARRSSRERLDMGEKAPIDQEESLLGEARANSSERENLQELFRVLHDTKKLKEAARHNVYALVQRPRSTAGAFAERKDGPQYRKVAIEDTIFLKSAPQEAGAKMNISFEGESISDPSIHWTVLYNDTTILLVRSANKYYYWKYAQTISALVIFGFIVVGNTSILYRLKSRRRRRSNVHYFIVQLAIADLLVGIFNVTLDSVLRIQQAFTYGLYACRASKYISSLFIYSSTNLLVALSLDRWEAVVRPLAFTRNRSRGHLLVAGSWLLAVLSALPVAYLSRVKEIDGLPQCWIDLDRFGWRLYLIYLTSLLLVIPTLIIAICYAHIVYTIWSKARLVSEQQRQRHEQPAQRSKDVERSAAGNGHRRSETLDERTRKSCLKLRLEVKRSGTIEVGRRNWQASQAGQLVKFGGRASERAQKRAPKTMAGPEGLYEEVYLYRVSQSGRPFEPKEASDTSEANNNALAALTSSSSASSSSSRSSSSCSSARSVATSRTSPLEAANDLAEAKGARKVATISGEPSEIGEAHPDGSLTGAPDAREVGGAPTCQLAAPIKQCDARVLPAQEEPDEVQARSSRRALSTDLAAGGPAMLAAGASDAPIRSVAGSRRPERRHSNHMAGESRAVARAHHREPQSNSMMSCDRLASSKVMSKRNQRRLRKLAAAGEARGPNSAQTYPGEFVAQQHGTGVIPKARIKTIKMTLVIVIAYILCWTPFLILNLLSVFAILQNETNFTHAIMTMTQSLAHLNSAVNPIIFWMFSSKRQAGERKPGPIIASNGQMNKQSNEMTPGGANGATNSKATCLAGPLAECWALLRWLLTCFSSDSATSQGYRATHSSMFERTTTTTNFSQTSSRHQQQRTGAP